MSTGNIAYLALVLTGFAAFMVTLSYGYIRCALPDRKAPAAPREEDLAPPLRDAA